MGTEAVGLGDRAERAPARVGLARACPGVGGRPSRPLPPLPGFMAPAGSREDRQRSSNGRRPGTREPPRDHLQQQILRDRPYATFLSVSQGAPFVFSLFCGRYSSQIHTIRLLYLDVWSIWTSRASCPVPVVTPCLVGLAMQIAGAASKLLSSCKYSGIYAERIEC